jgi:KUP system potassium uptake protein
LDATTYYLGRETLLPTETVPGMQVWREWVFTVMTRNAGNVGDYYNLPPERVVELGIRIEI